MPNYKQDGAKHKMPLIYLFVPYDPLNRMRSDSSTAYGRIDLSNEWW